LSHNPTAIKRKRQASASLGQVELREAAAMHHDSLLDFLQVYASPALLFNQQGELLYQNRASELCEGGEIATEVQAQSAIFKQPSLQSILPVEIHTSIYIKVPSEDVHFNFTKPHPEAAATSTRSSASRRSSSSSTSSSIARPGSSSSRPSSAKRRTRPSSKQASLGGLSNGSAGAGTSTGNGDAADQWEDEDCSTPTGYAIERRQLQWKVTQTKCKRVVALAQETASVTIPQMSAKDLAEQHKVTAIISTSWQNQPRFEVLKRGGGIMGDSVRSFNWDDHPLGPIRSWPQARVEMVGLVLRSPVPMTAYLEHAGYVIYNDAYIAVLGQTKHQAGCKSI
jgi:hypothetical protein